MLYMNISSMDKEKSNDYEQYRFRTSDISQNSLIHMSPVGMKAYPWRGLCGLHL